VTGPLHGLERGLEWDAALPMCAEPEELRHGLVHRDIKRNSQTGRWR
jgi:hypothetical protein